VVAPSDIGVSITVATARSQRRVYGSEERRKLLFSTVASKVVYILNGLKEQNDTLYLDSHGTHTTVLTKRTKGPKNSQVEATKVMDSKSPYHNEATVEGVAFGYEYPCAEPQGAREMKPTELGTTHEATRTRRGVGETLKPGTTRKPIIAREVRPRQRTAHQVQLSLV